MDRLSHGWGSDRRSDLLAELGRQNRVTRLRGNGVDIWVAAERLAQFQALLPDAGQQPRIAVPGAYADRDWTTDTSLVEILRGRLEGQAPVTVALLADALGLETDAIAAALAALEVEGFAMRGRFTPGANAEEWCARRLLARIHQYTLRRLRAEIEPVAARDFLRFLFAWQHVTAETRMEGPDALAATVAQLEGFEAVGGRLGERNPAVTGGRLRARVARRRVPLGRVTWARLRPLNPRANGTERGPGPVRTTPITLLARRHATPWQALSGKRGDRLAEHACSGGWGLHSRSTARRFSMKWWPEPVSCARRRRRRWPNWWLWGWSPPTASADCGHCLCHPTDVPTVWLDAAGAALSPAAG